MGFREPRSRATLDRGGEERQLAREQPVHGGEGRSFAYFRKCRKAEVQLRRITLPRTRVNKGPNRCRLAASQFAPAADKRLCFLDKRPQFLQRRVKSSRASPA